MNYTFLYGKWHITHSNFPMWLKGDRTYPTLNYAPSQKPQVLIDVVEFVKDGKVRQIRGTDYALVNTLEFIWRGNGLLGLLQSRWRIAYLAESRDWMILSFEKTLFTPAGHDIVVREGVEGSHYSSLMLARFNELFPNTEIYSLPQS